MNFKWIINRKITFSSVSSIASSLNFSLPPFLRMLSQKVASNSALELPATPLLQKTSKASLRAYTQKYTSKKGRSIQMLWIAPSVDGSHIPYVYQSSKRFSKISWSLTKLRTMHVLTSSSRISWSSHIPSILVNISNDFLFLIHKRKRDAHNKQHHIHYAKKEKGK